jgi:hypothetical protein
MLSRMVFLVATLGVFGAPDTEKETPIKKGDKLAAQPEIGDLSGYYTCKGQEAGGKHYGGVAMLLKKNDLYVVQWMVSGGSTFTGIGIRQGDTLAVSWALPSDRGALVRGVNMYKVEAGPRLVGRWASLPGPGVLQNETLSFLKKLDVEE